MPLADLPVCDTDTFFRGNLRRYLTFMNDEDIISASLEDGDGSSCLTDLNCDDCDREVAGDDPNEGVEALDSVEGTAYDESNDEKSDREEYERLIKTRFKELFREDTQRLINRRFKKYRALEEKVRRLEDEAKNYADIDSLLIAERERAVRETEERMNRQFKAMRARISENAVSPRSARSSLDVSKLTKSERASLASRALKGEKIHL